MRVWPFILLLSFYPQSGHDDVIWYDWKPAQEAGVHAAVYIWVQYLKDNNYSIVIAYIDKQYYIIVIDVYNPDEWPATVNCVRVSSVICQF